MCLCHYVKDVCKWFPHKSIYIFETGHAVDLSVYFCAPLWMQMPHQLTRLNCRLWERKKGVCDLYFVLMSVCAALLFLPHAAGRENSAGRIRKSPKDNKRLGRKGAFRSSDVIFIEGFMSLTPHDFSLQFNLIVNPPTSVHPQLDPHTPPCPTQCRHEAHGRKQLENHNCVTAFIFTHKQAHPSKTWLHTLLGGLMISRAWPGRERNARKSKI